MSYRALLTIKVKDGRNHDFLVLLGDTWDQAEKLAEIALRAKWVSKAITAIFESDLPEEDRPSPKLFATAEDRQTWIDTYADQTWEVLFERRGDYVQGTITGKDSGGEMIFFRKVVWHDPV